MSDLSLLSSRAILGRFYETLEQSDQNNWVEAVGVRFDSDQESETHRWLGQSPMMREWVGGRQPKGLRVNGFTIDNKKYEASTVIDVNDIRRDKTSQIMIRVDEMADRSSAHWVKLQSALVVANGTCYDGKAFFATTHQEGDSGVQVNLLTASEVPNLNVTEANPTAEEMAKAIIGVIQKFYGFKDDQGEPINENARSFLVVTPVFLWGPVAQAIANNMLSTGTGAIDNPLKNIRNLNVDHAVDPRLDATSTLRFYVYRTDGRAKPFILQEELPLETQMIAEGSEREAEKDEWFFGVKTVRNIGFGLWQHAISALCS